MNPKEEQVSVQKAYDEWANQYDTNVNRTRDLDRKATIDTLSDYTFSAVLELGCGTGKNTQWLVERAEHVIGLDFSEEMLNQARAKMGSAKVEFRQADLTTPWDIEKNSVDLVTSSLTLEHIANLDSVFDQAQEKLQSQGLFFVCELHPSKQYMGKGARFESDRGTIELEVYTHHISDYLNEAKRCCFELLELKEWFDTPEREGVPRLVSFLFRKK